MVSDLDGFGYRYFANKYNIPSHTIRSWREQYKIYGEESIEKSMSKTKYTSDFKLSVLKYRKSINFSIEKQLSILE